MSTSNVLNSAIQASFQKHFNRALIKAVTTSVKSNSDTLDPNIAIEAMELALQENGISADAVDLIKDLKTDQKVIQHFDQFNKAFGQDPSSSSDTPDPTKFSQIQVNKDQLAQLMDGVEKDLDLKVPIAIGKTTVKTVTSGLTIKGKIGEFSSASRALHIESELNKALQEFDNLLPEYKTAAFEQAFAKRHPPVEIEVDGKIITKTTLSPKQKALKRIEDALDASDAYLKEINTPDKGLLATIGKYGKKIATVAGPLATVGGGAYTAVWASDNIDKTNELYEKGIISEAEYKARKAQFKLAAASGALTISSGVVAGSKTIAEQVAKRAASSAAGSAAKNFVKVAPAIGDMLAIGMSSVSLAKNAIMADRARQTGNTGRTAVYGTMAALDSVNVILNSIGLALEFIPGAGNALSLVVNMVSVAVEFIKSTIEHFSKLFDNRSEAEKINEKFTQLVESDAFQKHVDALADDFKNQGYDIFEYVVDSQSAGIDGSDSGHGQVPAKKVLRLLSNNLFKQSFDKLKKAYIDTSYKDGDYHGLNGDDLIQILGGGNRKLYGRGGDDIIIDSKGNSRLDGGKGNDYLDGGAGVDEFYGGDGDDIVNFQPAIDKSADGGQGKDTLKVNFGNSDHITLVSGQMQHQLSGIHLDLANKQAGVGLGKDSLVDTKKNPTHAPSDLVSFFTGADTAKAANQLELLLNQGSSSIGHYADLVRLTKNHQLWQLAKTNNGIRYFTDGENIFKQDADGSVYQGHFSIKSISDSIVSWSSDHRTASVASGSEVIALLYLSFSSTDWVKNFENGDIQLSGASIANVYGDSQDNMIRMGQDAFGAIDTRGGNDTIVLETNVSIQNNFNNKFIYRNSINGGEGYDSLVLKNINTNPHISNRKYHAYYLVDKDHTSLNKLRHLEGHSYGNKDYNMISISGIESVVLDDSAADRITGSTTLDASALKQGMTYITNLVRKADVITSKHDDKIKINSAADGSQFKSSGGNDVLDFSGYRKGAVNVNLARGYVHGGLNALVTNFDNVFASRYSGDVLSGNSRDNTLVAQGGSDTVYGMAGEDHLVSRQGKHTLVGGEGSDLYTVMGPINNGSLSIIAQADSKGSVSILVDYGQGLQTLQPGSYNLNVLGIDQHELTLLPSINLKDSSGNTVNYNGLISVVNNQLVLNTIGHFDGLQANEKIQLSANYSSAGSVTRIDESGINNVLRLGGINDISDIQFAQDQDSNLIIKNSRGQNIIIDVQFGREFSSGKVTLAELTNHFMKRFPQINLLKNQKDLDMAQFKVKLSSFVSSLSNHELSINDRIIQSKVKQGTIDTKLGNDIIVADGFEGNSIDYIKAGSGDDIVLANRAWKGRESYDHPVSTIITTGAGNDTVVVGDENRSVYVDFVTGSQSGDKNTLVIDYKDLNHMAFLRSYNNGLSDFSIISTKTFRMSAIKGIPDKLVIKSNGNTYLTNDASQIDAILSGNQAFSPSNFVHFLDKAGSASLNLNKINSSQLKLTLKNSGNNIIASFAADNHGGFVSLEISGANQSSIYKPDLIKALMTEAQGNLIFSDRTFKGDEIKVYLENLIEDSSRVNLEPGASLVDQKIAAIDTPIQNKGKEEQVQLANASFESGGKGFVQDWTHSYRADVSNVANFYLNNKKAHGRHALNLTGGEYVSQVLHHEIIDTAADYKLKINMASYMGSLAPLKIRLMAGNSIVGAVTLSPQQYVNNLRADWRELEMHIDGSHLKNSSDDGQKLRIEIEQGRAIAGEVGQPGTLFDNVRLSKLTGAMATFDKDAISSDGSSTRGTTYVIRDIIVTPQA